MNSNDKEIEEIRRLQLERKREEGSLVKSVVVNFVIFFRHLSKMYLLIRISTEDQRVVTTICQLQ